MKEGKARETETENSKQIFPQIHFTQHRNFTILFSTRTEKKKKLCDEFFFFLSFNKRTNCGH